MLHLLPFDISILFEMYHCGDNFV